MSLLYVFGCGSKTLGVSKTPTTHLIDPETWITAFDFTCSPCFIGTNAYTLINFGKFKSAHDFIDHLVSTFKTKIKRIDENCLRIDGYHLHDSISSALLKLPFKQSLRV